MSLAALAYAMLAVDRLTGPSNPSSSPLRARRGLGEVGGHSAVGSAINLFEHPEEARRISPVFQRGKIRATIEPGGSIDNRARRIAGLIRDGARDPAVRRLAGWILAQRGADGEWKVAEKDWKGEADAIYWWMRKNMRYTKDHATIDTYAHPARTLFDRPAGVGAIGDCDDATSTGGALLAAVGHQPVLRIVAARQGNLADPDFNHIFLLDELPSGGVVGDGKRGRLYPLDMSLSKGPGWQPPREMIAKYKDFRVPL